MRSAFSFPLRCRFRGGEKAKEKGESYVGGYILGEVTQTVAAAGAAAAAGKGLKGAKAVDKGGDIAKTLNAVRKPLAKNEGKQFKAAAKGIKKITKGKADKVLMNIQIIFRTNRKSMIK